MNKVTLKKIRNQYYKLIEKSEKEDLFLEFCNLIDKDLSRYSQNQITLFHFYFQDMKPYFEHFGDKMIYELINKIHSKIKNYITVKDSIYQWNLRSIMVISSSHSEVDNLYKRLDKIEFDFNGVNLQYELSYLNLANESKKTEDIWKNFINSKILENQ